MILALSESREMNIIAVAVSDPVDNEPLFDTVNNKICIRQSNLFHDVGKREEVVINNHRHYNQTMLRIVKYKQQYPRKRSQMVSKEIPFKFLSWLTRSIGMIFHMFVIPKWYSITRILIITLMASTITAATANKQSVNVGTNSRNFVRHGNVQFPDQFYDHKSNLFKTCFNKQEHFLSINNKRHRRHYRIKAITRTNYLDVIMQLRAGDNDKSEIDADDKFIRHENTEEERYTDYVKTILSKRYQYVISNQRTYDLQKWLLQRKDTDSTVLSLHGVSSSNSNAHFTTKQQRISIQEPNGEDTTNTTKEKLSRRYNIQEPIWYHTKDPFSVTDRLNLDIVITQNTPKRLSNKQLFTTRQEQIWLQDLINDDILQIPTKVQIIKRFIQLIGYHFSIVLLTLVFAIISKQFRQHIWYKLIVSAMGSAGPAWIKWGQWASTRRDMFPSIFCDDLSLLHNTAPVHSYQYTQFILQHSLGIQNLDTIFPHLSKQPIASGSIAQVHRATISLQSLKNYNRMSKDKTSENINDKDDDNSTIVPVAIKVRHPNVAKLIDIDFRIMIRLVQGIEYVLPIIRWLQLSSSVQQFSSIMAEQAALNVEAHHLELFTINFFNNKKSKDNMNQIRFPQPIYSSPSVIIETYENGIITSTLIEQYTKLAKYIDLVHTNTNRQQEQQQQQQQTNSIMHNKNQKVNNSNNNSDIDTYNTNSTTSSSSSSNISSQSQQQQDEQPLLRACDVMPTSLAKFIVTTGSDIYLQMLLIDNLMHAGMFGNIFFLVPV
jgi:predicted unusual protein kinase regulating ubiquinone biosynthesis (AarF/ABC1/UbiB family)